MSAAAKSTSAAAAPAVSIPLRLRLKAWWYGYELELRRKARAIETELPKHGVRYSRPAERWESSRLKLVQAVWGEGFSSPGGSEYLLELVKPFGLDETMSLLDLGAGLGGPDRLMAQNFGVWVTGLEQDHNLAAAGMGLSTKAGLGKKAPIQPYDPEAIESKPKSYDCVFSKEAFFTIKAKERLIKLVQCVLKDRGQFLFTDYVLGEQGRTPTVEAWMKKEPQTPDLWDVERYLALLRGLKLDIRITEDITTPHKDLIVKGWADYMAQVQMAGLDHELLGALVDEAEIWARRVELLDSGDLKVCRIHVLKKTS